MNEVTIGFLGLGLIGGSIAKGIRRHHKNYTLIGYNHNYSTAQTALEEGVLDFAVKEVDASFSRCDIIYLCMPVSYNVEYLKKIKPYLKPSCILTDVGSVKGNIHKAVKELELTRYFIGGHPMAGSEKTGYANSTDHLLENACYPLTPCEDTDPVSLQLLKDLTASLGAIPFVLSEQEHDYAVAAISHLPHLIASGLVNLIRLVDSKEQLMKTIAAGGFKDITRIASASPVMWQQICLTNRDNIVTIMDQYLSYLTEIKDAIVREDTDYLYHFFDSGREYRNSIPAAPSGPVTKIYDLYCDLIDKPGSIAKAATILADAGVSIKNIGITHIREYQEDVLCIEFYTQEDAALAGTVLKEHNYQVTQP